MEQGTIVKQMIDFNRTLFDNSFNAMAMIQDQTERIANMSMEQPTWIPEEGKKLVDEWSKTYRHGCEDFKDVVDENFKKAEDFLSGPEKAKKVITKSSL